MIELPDLSALPQAAAEFIAKTEPGVVYAFYGKMGAGKTTFIGEVCRQLGCDDEPNSPTFSIVNEYDTEKWGKIYHFDCYRLDSEEEGLNVGAEDYFYSGHTCFVEWPEKIEGLLPDDTVIVRIDVDDNGSRRIEIS